jgi:hypothetical protein
LLPNAVEVKTDSAPGREPLPGARQGLQPRELLASYFEHVRVNDESALKLFDELVEEDHAADPA